MCNGFVIKINNFYLEKKIRTPNTIAKAGSTSSDETLPEENDGTLQCCGKIEGSVRISCKQQQNQQGNLGTFLKKIKFFLYLQVVMSRYEYLVGSGPDPSYRYQNLGAGFGSELY